jgi:hypothetical protein
MTLTDWLLAIVAATAVVALVAMIAVTMRSSFRS